MSHTSLPLLGSLIFNLTSSHSFLHLRAEKPITPFLARVLDTLGLLPYLVK